VIEDSYHMVHVDRQHALVAERTAAFFGAGARTRTPQKAPVDA